MDSFTSPQNAPANQSSCCYKKSVWLTSCTQVASHPCSEGDALLWDLGAYKHNDNRISPLMSLKEYKVLIFWHQSIKESFGDLLSTSSFFFNSGSIQINFQAYLHYKDSIYNLEATILHQLVPYLQSSIAWPMNVVSWKKSENQGPRPSFATNKCSLLRWNISFGLSFLAL